VLSILVFFGYGLYCLVSPSMLAEFERYGLARLRKLTGVLEIAGALGLLASYWFPVLLPITAGCLGLMMVIAIGTRYRIGDPALASVPAALLLLINVFMLLHRDD